MKKLLFVLLTAALALPMMAQMNAARKVVNMDRDQVVVTTPISSDWSAISKRAGMTTWDFSTEDQLDGWMALDNDGDGVNWYYDSSNGHTAAGCLGSASYDYSAGGVLTPDNWLISPEVTLDGVLKFWASPYSSSFPDVFAVYVAVGEGLDINDYVKIGSDYAPTAWTEFTFDLTEYQGQTGHFAIRHYNCSDMWRLLIDDISIGVEIPPMAMPENVTAEPAATTAEVAWEGPEDATGWDLRYRPVVDVENLAWDFEEESDIADWTFIDSDGDGFNWQYFNNEGATSLMSTHEGMGLMASASYDKASGAALTPDNWMISPKVVLDGTLSFWAVGQDPSYAAEVFGVYVSTDMENWYQLGEDFTATGEYVEYTFDLSGRAGEEGYFAIRHYNVTDMFWLNIDDVTITYGEEPEWTVVEGVTSPYTIEGLDPETEYEVQVMAYNDEQETDWTESTVFTTLADQEPPTPTERTGAPTFNGYTTDGIHAYFIEILPTEPSTIYYRIQYNDEEFTEWAEYEDVLSFTEDGHYRVEAYAVAPGKLESYPISYEFYVTPFTGLSELASGKTVAGVRYFNMAGQEMPEANGMTIVVTTYTDGTTSAAKVIK